MKPSIPTYHPHHPHTPSPMPSAPRLPAPAAALALTLGLALLATGCATKHQRPSPSAPAPSGKNPVAATTHATPSDPSDWDTPQAPPIHDPIEPVNRGIHWFNHGLYTVIVKPVAKTYQFVLPQYLRDRIHCAYENIEFPVRFTNHLLQARFDRSGLELARFATNTTLGVGGLYRISDRFPALKNLPEPDTSTTLTKYGIPHGAYIVLPVLGPTSTRDIFGIAGDAALNPVSWASFIFGGAAWTVAITAPNTVRQFPDRMDQYDAVTKDAPDPYVALRTGYLQFRHSLHLRTK